MKNIFKKKRKKQQLDNKIDFADKYIYGDNYSDKFDTVRGKDKKDKKVAKEKVGRSVCISAVAIFSILTFCMGYFIVSVNMERNNFSLPNALAPDFTDKTPSNGDTPTINDTNLELMAARISSDYFDAGAMLNATIEKAVNAQYNSILFDVKRPNGSLSYNSQLTLATTFNAVASPGIDVPESIKSLLQNSIIPVATIYCFSDNIAPLVDSNVAIKTANGAVWKDKSGNTWLNPYSSIAVDYLVSIAKEIAEMGIKNIVLDGVSFPAGNLSKAVFAEGVTQPEQSKLDEFVEKVKSAVPSDCRVSVASRSTFNSPEEFETILPNLKVGKSRLPIIDTEMLPTDALKLLSESGVSNYVLVANTPSEKPQVTEN